MNKALIAMAFVVAAFLGTSTVTAQTACIPAGGVATGTFPFGAGNDSNTCLNTLRGVCCSGAAAVGSSCNCIGNPLPNTCVGTVTCALVASPVATPSFGAGGTISPNVPVNATQGQILVFTLTPSAFHGRAVTGTCGGTLVGNIFTTNAIHKNCTVIASFSDLGCLDVDGNGQVQPLTDGLMLLRAMLGLKLTAVTNGAIGTGTPTRTTWATIQPFLNANCGTNFAP